MVNSNHLDSVATKTQKRTDMRLLIVLVASALYVSSLPVEEKKNDDDDGEEGVGGYGFAFATSNGIHVQEEGELQNVGNWDEGIAVQGKYEFTAPNGVVYTVEYVADNNGFRPKMHFKKS